MLEILVLIGGVDAQEIVVVGHLMHQDVVHKSAVFVEQPRIVRLAVLQLRDVVGGDEIGQPGRFRPVDFDLAHVADIEDADGIANGVVLGDDAGILDGHIPAAEIDHPGAERAMDGVQRRFEERRFGHEESG